MQPNTPTAGILMKSSGMTRASAVILVVILFSIVGVVGYGGYHYVSDHPSLLHSLGFGGGTTSSNLVTTLAENTASNVGSSSTGSQSSQASSSAGNSGSEIISSSSSSPSESVTTLSQSTSEQSSLSNSSQSAEGQQNPFVQLGSASVVVSKGEAFLNVTFQSQNTDYPEVYLNESIYYSENSSFAGSASVNEGLELEHGQQLAEFYAPLGSLAHGSYYVTFVLETPAGTPLSEPGKASFTI